MYIVKDKKIFSWLMHPGALRVQIHVGKWHDHAFLMDPHNAENNPETHNISSVLCGLEAEFN